VPLTIAYFSWVRERMGRDSEEVDPPAEVQRIDELVAWLCARDAAGAAAFADPRRIRAARDSAMVPLSAPIAGAREIALFPPVTGG